MAILNGIDIVKVARIKAAADKNDSFLKRIFSEEEIRYCLSLSDPWPSFAARFAVKESFYKAFAGSEKVFAMKDIGLIKKGRRPLLVVDWDAKGWRSPLSMDVSISHEREYAVAVLSAEVDDAFYDSGEKQ